MNTGVPMMTRLAVSAAPSIALTMPKSITRGPSAAMSALPGLRSLCTSPQACTAWSASTRPPASRHTASSERCPASAITPPSDGPATNAVASHGGSSSGPAATTGAVKAPLTACAARTSRRNRARNSGSRASSGCTTLTATTRPAGERQGRPAPCRQPRAWLATGTRLPAPDRPPQEGPSRLRCRPADWHQSRTSRHSREVPALHDHVP